MADADKPKPPESPTTGAEPDFDDEEDVNTSGKPAREATATTGTQGAPKQQTRTLSPQEQAEQTLKEAFPTIDAAVVKAVLNASGGQVEPAFNALLGMSDPSAQQQEAPAPPQPPRPQAAPAGQSQLEQDEMYARRLAERYQHEDYARSRQQGPGQGQGQQGSARAPRQGGGLSPNQQGYYEEERERSFIDDDLPVIRDNIKKGFLETQKNFNSFITNLKKTFDEDEEQPPPQPPRRPNQQPGEFARRSGDHTRYDADPQVLSDDFTALQMRDETGSPKAASGRPAANPDLFKPTPAIPQSESGRKVSFQEGTEDINESLYRASPDPTKRGASPANKNSKWQPLASVDPDPVAEHDPFSLGDSDDDDAKKKDVKPEDAERLKKATAEAMADELGSPGKGGEAAKKS